MSKPRRRGRREAGSDSLDGVPTSSVAAPRASPALPPGVRPTVSRSIQFAVLLVGCLAVAVAYISWAAIRNQADLSAAPGPIATALGGPATPSTAPSGSASSGEAPRLVFQNVARDAAYAKVAVLPVDQPGGSRIATDLTCERVYMTAEGGLCLVPEAGLIARYWAVLFDSDFKERSRIELIGSPSRARISADGRYGATTVFVFGHSYADAAFSTQTSIIDMSAGTPIGELEQFTVYRDGTRIHSPDFNFWGVTFASDSNTFYATLRTGGHTYLVEGDIAARELRVLHDNVECPSLSPDGTRLAFKKQVGDPGQWRFTVLDLATMTETPLAETESVDDQIEWLDDGRVIYGKAGSLWMVPSDGTGTPELFVRDALSPAVLR